MSLHMVKYIIYVYTRTVNVRAIYTWIAWVITLTPPITSTNDVWQQSYVSFVYAINIADTYVYKSVQSGWRR